VTLHLCCLEPGTLISHLRLTSNFLKRGTNSQLESLSTDLTLQLDNIVYLCCKKMWFLAVSYWWAETILHNGTKVKCCYVFFVHPVLNSTRILRPSCPKFHKRFFSKNVRSTHTFNTPENLILLETLLWARAKKLAAELDWFPRVMWQAGEPINLQWWA